VTGTTDIAPLLAESRWLTRLPGRINTIAF
jgi:hypothetical protein